MDANILLKALLTNQFTDIDVVLKSQSSILTLNLHKLVLYSSSEYFREIFEADITIRTIQISTTDINMTRDIILSFYGQPLVIPTDPLKKLSYIKCINLFKIPISTDLLLDLENFIIETIQRVKMLVDTQNVIKELLPNLQIKYSLVELLQEKVMLDKNIFLAYGKKRQIYVYDIYCKKSLTSFKANHFAVRHVSYSPCNKLLLSCGDDHLIKIYNAYNFTLINVLIESFSNINFCVFSPNCRKIVSICDYYYIILWDTFTGKLLKKINATNYDGTYVSYVENLSLITDNILIWIQGKKIFTYNLETDKISKLTDTYDVYNVIVSSDKKVIIALGMNFINIYDGQTLNLLRSKEIGLDDSCKSYQSMSHNNLSSNNQFLVYVSYNECVKIFDLTLDTIVTVVSKIDQVYSVFLSHDDDKIIGKCKNFIKIFDIKSKNMINLIKNSHTIAFGLERPNKFMVDTNEFEQTVLEKIPMIEKYLYAPQYIKDNLIFTSKLEDTIDWWSFIKSIKIWLNKTIDSSWLNNKMYLKLLNQQIFNYVKQNRFYNPDKNELCCYKFIELDNAVASSH